MMSGCEILCFIYVCGIEREPSLFHLVVVREHWVDGGRRFAFAVATFRRNPLPPKICTGYAFQLIKNGRTA